MAFLDRMQDELSMVDLKPDCVVVVGCMLAFFQMDCIKGLTDDNAVHPHTINFVMRPWFVILLLKGRNGLLE